MYRRVTTRDIGKTLNIYSFLDQAVYAMTIVNVSRTQFGAEYQTSYGKKVGVFSRSDAQVKR